MCDECGCEELEINKNVLDENDKIASKIHHHLLHKKVLPINIMGSPGSGKTTFIEQLAQFIEPEEIAVIQGDLESEIDKEKLEKMGMATYQINTHSGCHLNADMIKNALEKLDLSGKKYLLIENVGNLVCPADIKLGQEVNIVISSTTEGSDKPAKYPVIFYNADFVIISKNDLAEHVNFNAEEYKNYLKKLKQMEILETSIKETSGFERAARLIKEKYKHWEHQHHHH